MTSDLCRVLLLVIFSALEDGLKPIRRKYEPSSALSPV